MSYRNRQYGFTIIEIMVAVTIGLILMAGVSNIFLANRTTYRLQEGSANVQENGRFGMEFLTRDVRMTGFVGCASPKTVALTNNLCTTPGTGGCFLSTDAGNTVLQFDGTNALMGYTYDGTFPSQLTNLGLSSTDVVQGTDVLYIQHATACEGGDVVCHNNQSSGTKSCPGGAVNAANYQIADNSECQIQQNDILLVSNCVTADIHGVTNNPSGTNDVTITHGSNLHRNSPPRLSNSYGEGSAIYKMTAELYYIGFGASGEPALFRRVLRSSNLVSEELVEGIYGMDIEYGEDTNNDAIANRYVEATDVTDWADVINLRITLHARSIQDNITTNDNTYPYNGANVTDRRLRRDFTSTITIRNRVK